MEKNGGRFDRSSVKGWRSPFIVAMAVMGLLAPLAVAVPAASAVGPNPHTDIVVTKVFDGTGHGTASAAYVNTANGFVPGDDAPNDGVVASGDLVGYDITVSVRAGLARTVAITMTGSELLDWSFGRDQFCAPAPGITAQVVGDTCQLSIRQGATAQLTRQVQLTAGDSNGLAVGGQRLSTEVGLAGQQPYAVVESGPVTVVSAPKADLVVRGGSVYTWSESAGAGTGSFMLEARPLRPVGFSPTKGVSTGGVWQVVADVSAFPAGTTWQLGGVDVVPAGGQLQLTGVGNRQLTFVMPGGVWPDQEEGSTEWYDLGVTVPETAFATEDYLNNGDGWQPGTGLPRETTTYDPDSGAIRGFVYPNNDYSAIQVQRPIPVDGDIFSKQVVLPHTPGETRFEAGNTSFAEATGVEFSPSWSPRQRPPGSEYRAVLNLHSENVAAGGVAVLGDFWDPAQASATGPVTVTVDGATVDPGLYTVQWSAAAVDDGSLSDPGEAAGWVATGGPLPGANAVRVVFTDGAVGSDSGTWTVTVPMQVRAEYPETADPIVRDTLQGRADGETGSAPGALQVVWPPIPTLGVTQTVDQESVYAGETLAYTVTPAVTNPPTVKNGFQAEITVELDRCEVEPRNTGSVWTMQVTPAVPGPSGRVCGDLDSTPALLTFTPASGNAIGHSSWSSGLQRAMLPAVTYTARTTLSATDTVGTVAQFALAGMGDTIPVFDDSQSVILAQFTGAAHIEANQAKVEIGDLLSWNIELVQQIGDGTASTVIVLPRDGDGVYWDDDLNPDDQYPDAKASDFHGGYTVASVSTNGDDTSPGVELWFTTDPVPSLDATVGDWYRVAEAGTGAVPPLAGATAVKVVADAPEDVTSTALVTVELDPVGNHEDDVYLMWVGETVLSGAGEGAPQPWPAQSVVVMSEISGTVWWDEDRTATMQAGELRIQGVEVGVFAVVDGVVAGTPLATTVTDGDGFYEFTGLRSGSYVTRVIDRGANLPGSAESHYLEQIDVEHSYSFQNQRFARASDTSTVIGLGLDASRTGVDYGYFQPDPLADVDKTVADVSCTDGVCELVWTVEIVNLGNTDLSGGTFTDTVSDSVYDVEAFIGEFIPRDRVVEVVPRGYGGGYALTQSGEVYSWGIGISGANGNGGTDDNTTAQLVQGLPAGEVVEVVARDHLGGYALTESGEVYSWGSGAYGSNGNGGTDDNVTAQLVQGLSGVQVVEVVTRGNNGAYALTQSGDVYAWGLGYSWTAGGSGSNGNGGADDNLTAQIVQGLPAGEVVEVVARSDNAGAYVLTQSGEVYSWGQGAYGANGNGGIGDNTTAALVQGLPAGGVIEVVSRDYGGFALTHSGEVYSWGQGSSGANGNGGTGDNVTAQIVQGLSGVQVVGVVARSDNAGAYALTHSGDVYAWGAGGSGANGNGGFGNNLTAQIVQGLSGVHVVEVLARENGGYALTQSDDVYAWGAGTSGANGSGSTGTNFTAQPVLGLPEGEVAEIAARADGGYALTSSGNVYSWGRGGNGQNGNGTANNFYAEAVLTPDYMPLGGGGLPMFEPSNAILPVSVVHGGGFVERSYAVPFLPAGESVPVVYRGKVNQADAVFNVLNQAWFTSPATPIAGLLPAGQQTPTLPEDPGPGPDPAGIPGNATCNTDADAGGQAVADSCDQVPIQVPASGTLTGALSGVVWVDADQSGVRAPDAPLVPGVPVTLFYSDMVLGETVMGETVTDEHGAYVFANLPPRDGYFVVFGISQTPPSAEILTALGLDPALAWAYGYTAPGAGCAEDTSCVDPVTWATAPATVVSGGHVEHQNAGVVLANAGLEVVKTSTVGDPAAPSVNPDGFTDGIGVELRFTNIGSEPLTGFWWADETLDGPDLTGLDCAADPATLVLQPGDTVDCTATLTDLGLDDPAHRDRFTVSAVGQISGTPVTGSDTWEAVADGEAGWSLSKTADPATGSWVGAGSEITYTIEAVNTGDLTLTGIDVFDDLSGVLPYAALDDDGLPADVQRSGATLVWTIAELAPGASVSIQYTVQIDDDAWGQTLENRVTAAGDLAPDACTLDAPCVTEHHTPPWPGALPLPVLGNLAMILILLLGLAAVAAGIGVAVRRNTHPLRKEH